MALKLCCLLSPAYDCQACGFQECDVCYDQRCISNRGLSPHLRTFHIVEDDEGDDACRDTLIKLWSIQKDNRPLCEYASWAIKANLPEFKKKSK